MPAYLKPVSTKKPAPKPVVTPCLLCDRPVYTSIGSGVACLDCHTANRNSGLVLE